MPSPMSVWAPTADHSWQQQKPIKISAALARSPSLTSLTRKKDQPHLWLQLAQEKLGEGNANPLCKAGTARKRSVTDRGAQIVKAPVTPVSLFAQLTPGDLCLSYRENKNWQPPSNRSWKRGWEGVIFPLLSPKPLIFTLVSYYLRCVSKHKFLN